MNTSPLYNSEYLNGLKKQELIKILDEYNIKKCSGKKKDVIIQKIIEHQINCTKKIIPVDMKDDKQYSKIYHISDIHIRVLSRHVEYKEVFNNLYSFLEEEKEEIIISITGDIMHSKDILKPETILLCRNFMKELSRFGTVIVIAGNHDMLENNEHRLDSLSAVLLDLPVHYLYETNAYKFGNLIISTSSLIDKKFLRRDQIIVEEDIPVICMYHGTISGSRTDCGYIMENKD